MSLQFIIGGSGSGKTRTLYENLIKDSIEHREERFFAVVPEQFTMQTQKDLVMLHPDHGVMNIDIVSFERLAYRIFEERGIEHLSVLNDMGKSMVLRKVAAEKKKELKLFGGHLEKVGFIGELKSMLSEFFQYGITKERLQEMIDVAESGILKQKLRDMLVLYQAFHEYIEGKFIAKEEILEVLCRELPYSELIKGSVITLDGYTGFTPIQYRVLDYLLKYCKKVIVTITLDPRENPYKESGQEQLFHMSRHTVCRLIDLAAKGGVERNETIFLDAHPAHRFKHAPAIGFIEEEIFRYRKAVYKEQQGKEEEGKNLNSQLLLCQGDMPLKEVEFIAGEIERLIKTEGYRYRDIAVVTGALDEYSKEIVRQFRTNKIPFFMDYKKNIMGNPMVELIRAVLEIFQRDFSYESMFRYLKSGLVTEETEKVSRLENYVLALGIRGFKRWNSQWERVYKGAELINLVELNEFRKELLEPLIPLREVMKNRKATVKDRTEALVHFLMTIQVEEKLQEYETLFASMGENSLEKEYSQVYGLVMELFDHLNTLLGQEIPSKKEFAEILDAGFAEIKVGVIPAVVDRVSVGDITRTRLSHIKVLFFAGVNDGIIPAVSGRGGILSETERRKLKEHRVELAPTVREESFLQRFYLYLIMTKPSDKLYLSYSLMSSDGKSLRPSSLITQIRKLFPGLEPNDIKDRNFVPWSDTMGKRHLIEGLRDYEKKAIDAPFLELYRYFLQSAQYEEKVKDWAEAAFYAYKEHGIGRSAAKEIYSQILQGSVTRMERYAACAYSYFLAYGLELKERTIFELAAADIGNLFHSSIDLFFKRMKEEGRSFQTIEEEDRKKLVEDCVSEVTKDYGNTILKSSSRNAYLERKIYRITERTIWALTEQLRRGDFEPTGFEVSFSPADHLKAMKIPVSSDEEIHLKGRIDRMDLCEDGDLLYLKIIDYKTGKTEFDLMDLYYGLQMQLVVYMDAALEKEQRKHPDKKVVPAGLFYYNISDPMIERKTDMDEEDREKEILKQLRMNGLVNSEKEVIEHLDHRIETVSDVIPVAVKAGIIQEAKSSVVNEERFYALSRFINKKLKSIGREILDGHIAAEPYKRGTKTACDYCPYHSICGFDLKTDGYGYRRFKKMKPEEIWEKIDGNEKEEEGKCIEAGEEKEDEGRSDEGGDALDQRAETGH